MTGLRGWFRAGAARPAGRPCVPGRPVTWRELMTPRRALAGLRTQLAARDTGTAGMTITRWQGILTLASGTGAGHSYGWPFWPAGRLSAAGARCMPCTGLVTQPVLLWRALGTPARIRAASSRTPAVNVLRTPRDQEEPL